MKDKFEMFFTWSAKILLIHKPIDACETTCKVMTDKFWWMYPGVTVGYANVHIIINYGIIYDTIAELH